MKKIILLPIVLLALLVSCQMDEVAIHSSENEQTVELAVRTSIKAGSGDNTETIRELELVVCKDGIYQYSRSAYASEYALFRSSLKVDRGVDIYFFANCSNILTSGILQEGRSWEAIRSELILTQTHRIENGETLLPLWGELENVTVSDHKINQLRVTLLRAVGVADIHFEFEDVQNFTPVVTHLYYGADKAFIAPHKDNLDYQSGALAGVIEPISPSGMTTTLKSSATPVANQVVNSLYMFDNPVEEGNNAGNIHNKRTRVVIGGHYQGSDKMSYYALDFFDDTLSPEQWLRATRNHRYVLKVTSVKSAGWETPDQAAESATVNLDYDVISWEDYQYEYRDIATDGPDYLSINRRYLPLDRKSGSKGYIHLMGTYTENDIKLDFTTTTNGEITYISSGEVQNNRFHARVVENNGSLSVVVTTRGAYSTQNPSQNKDTLIIRAGRIEFTISLEQKTPTWDLGGNQEIDL